MSDSTKITLDTATTEQLCEWRGMYPWWGAPKCALHKRGEKIEGGVLYALRQREQRAPIAPLLKTVKAEELRRSQMLNIIDEFLLEGEHRIVIDEATTDAPIEEEIGTSDELEEEFISEELAEIYAKQHLFDLAIEIYQKLSLQDTQKSVYFAELIEALKKQSLEQDKK